MKKPSRVRVWRRSPASGVGLLVCVALALAGISASSAVAAPLWSFGYTGESESFTVPPDVEKLSLLVVGGAGGQSDSNLGGAAGGDQRTLLRDL